MRTSVVNTRGPDYLGHDDRLLYCVGTGWRGLNVWTRKWKLSSTVTLYSQKVSNRQNPSLNLCDRFSKITWIRTTASSRKFGWRHDVSKRTILNDLRGENLHQYYYQRVQCFTHVYYAPHYSFVSGSDNFNIETICTYCSFFKDEVSLIRDRVTNFHKTYIWTHSNCQFNYLWRHQHQFLLQDIIGHR